ncbi:EAL domain-containing protein [Sulfuritalea sp.]|uniref:EAL domain-containing protein n=1 Tax=Sulfuritalea sp. TaxID=2480090 RepID=UPI00286DD1D0|nr:EAL domain-containing protein [Sulfuritalea sp.]
MSQEGQGVALPRQFALARHFSIASLVCTIIVAVLLGWSYQYLALRDLKHLAEDRNLALTHALSNSLWPKFSGLMAANANTSPTALRAMAYRDSLYTLVARQMKDTDVVKVKIYALDGMTVFSSDPTQTGEDKRDNSAFRAARDGQVTSGLTHRHSFDAFEGTRNHLDIISTYLPIRDEQKRIVAVFEIYSDVTDLTTQLGETRSIVIATVLGLLALLYALQYVFVARAQRTIDGQQMLLKQSIQDLDRRVHERTASLDATNLSLLKEIEERKQVEQILRESTARYQAVTQSANDAIVTADSRGNIVGWNRQAEAAFGYTEAEIISQPLTRLIPERHRESHVRGIDRVLAGGESRVSGKAFETEGLRRDGTEFPIELSLAKWEVGDKRYVSGTIRDISERIRTEQHLRVAATTFEAQEGVTITDANKVILRVNRAFTEITGYDSDEAVGNTPHMLSSGRHDPVFYESMWGSLARTGSWQGEIWNRRKNGEEFPEWLSITAVRGIGGEVTNYVGTFADITERKAAENEIAQLAFYDHLTGLPNRRLLLDRLRHALAGCVRNSRCGALMFFDLDNFKTLNDTLGHDVGDQLLVEVASRLQSSIRQSDTVARLGGDEFVVVLEDLDGGDGDQLAAMQAEALAVKIQAMLSQPYLLDIVASGEARGKRSHHCSSSIGITLFDRTPVTAEELMKRADTAMYQAKALGRNTLRFFDPAMQAAVTAHAALENDLRKAIAERQFLVHYQAQVDFSGQVIGAEALVRWQHPQRGLVHPTEFIPLAEDTGLIQTLGHWVLETACRQLAAWAARPETRHLTLAVNVSAQEFRRKDFVEEVLETIRSTGANPQRLKLELTESQLVHNVQEIIDKMLLLKAVGVGFSLDDFGTGYSSLAYLKRMPLDQLKIDQSFVRDVLLDSNDAAIARTVVALAHSLGLGVIAEGVESALQRDFLANSGCHAYQGFFFSRPLPLEEFERFARQA